MDPGRTPVIAAVGQSVERDEIVSAIDMAERATAAALDEAPALASGIDQVSMVGILSRHGPAPASELAARLRLGSPRCETTSVGGNSPQWLVTRAATEIAAGRLGSALICGGESMSSSRRIRAGAPKPPRRDDLPSPEHPDEVVGDQRPGVGPAEMAGNLMLPAHLYPLLESVLAAGAGRSFADHRVALGELMAPFTDVAAKHPYAWFPESRTAAEIAEPSDDNRVTAEPYTKRMNSVLSVDQGAAVVVTSLERAREAGCAEGAVYVWAGADATDVWFPTARPDLGASPALAAASSAAFAAAGIGIDDIALVDLYSCFPVAVEIAAAALGIALDDGRGLTVTGGLPYFGGPGNNYVTHSLATMVEELRGNGGIGVVTGLGWYVTKHAVGIYGATPPPAGFQMADTSEAQATIDASELPVAEAPEGAAVVDGATVVYDHDGRVSTAPVIATLADGTRVAADTAADDDERQALAGVNLVGATVEISESPPRYRVTS